MTGLCILVVKAEVALPHELIALGALALYGHGSVSQTGFHLAALENDKAFGVEVLKEILVLTIGIRIGEEVVIESDLRIGAVSGIDPVNGRALDLAAVCGVAAAAFGVILAVDFLYAAVGVLGAAGAGDEICTLETDFVAGIEALILGCGLFQEVLGLDIKLAGESDLADTVLLAERVIFHGESFALSLGVVGDNQLDGIENCHNALCIGVQIVSQAAFKQCPVHGGVHLGNADTLAEIADGARSIAAAAQTAEGGHTGIVPTAYSAFLHKLSQLALGHNGVIYAKAGKLYLTGLVVGDGYIVDDPVVKGPVILVLKGAEGMGDTLQCVLNGVGKVIHGENAPLCTLTVMLNVADAVDDRVAHIEVAAFKVYLGTESVFALLELAISHTAEKVETFFNGPVPPGADGRAGSVAAVFAELLRSKLAYIGQTLFYKLLGVLIGLLKIVGTIEESVAPVKAQPVNIFLNCLDELGVLLGRVGVIHTQIADAAKLFSSAKVDGQCLAVTDMQISVGFGREAGVYLHSVAAVALGKIFDYKGINKVS